MNKTLSKTHHVTEKEKKLTFDFVCHNCRRVYKHPLSALQSGNGFKCPYCKTAYGVIDGKIQVTEVKPHLVEEVLAGKAKMRNTISE